MKDKNRNIYKVSLQDFVSENVFHYTGVKPFSQDELDFYVDKAKQLGFDVLAKFAGTYGKRAMFPDDIEQEVKILECKCYKDGIPFYCDGDDNHTINNVYKHSDVYILTIKLLSYCGIGALAVVGLSYLFGML